MSVYSCFLASKPIIFMLLPLSKISNSWWGHKRQVSNCAFSVWEQPEALNSCVFQTLNAELATFLFNFTCWSTHPIKPGPLPDFSIMLLCFQALCRGLAVKIMSLLVGNPFFEEVFCNLAGAAKPSASDSMLFGVQPHVCRPTVWSLWGYEYIGFP